MASRTNDNIQTNTGLPAKTVRSTREHLDRFCDKNMWLLGGWIHVPEENNARIIRQIVSFSLKSAANSDR